MHCSKSDISMAIPLKKTVFLPPTAVTANRPSGRMEETNALGRSILIVYPSDWIISFPVLTLAWLYF